MQTFLSHTVYSMAKFWARAVTKLITQATVTSGQVTISQTVYELIIEILRIFRLL